MKENFLTEKNRYSMTISFWALFGIGFPIISILYFYISYAGNAWFWMDDFGFIDHYARSIHWSELFDFTSFGRFLSRNAYWYIGVKYFHHNAQYFYIFNFFIILCSSLLLYKIFEKWGRFAGVVAGVFYFILPATIESYAWISNSQHILGHFFVILFIFVFIDKGGVQNKIKEIVYVLNLILILVFGFASNIFVSMVLSLPFWMVLTDKNYRNSKAVYFVLLMGFLLFVIFFANLSGGQTGAYSTSYNISTFIDNARFYFNGGFGALLWIVFVVFGVLYGVIKKKYFISWLFLGSVAFFLPFAFFIHQRALQYGALAYLFFLLGGWSVLIDSGLNKYPNLMGFAATLIILLLFSKALEPSVRYFSANPRGAEQKLQVQFLRNFEYKNAEFKSYCFRVAENVNNATGVKEWDIPSDWWFVGFGRAFNIFVSQEKTYDLSHNSERCDAVFLFKNGRLEIDNEFIRN